MVLTIITKKIKTTKTLKQNKKTKKNYKTNNYKKLICMQKKQKKENEIPKLRERHLI